MGAITISFPAAKGRVVVTASGELSASDITEAAARVYADPQFRAGMDSLLDIRKAQQNVSPDEVRTMVEAVARNMELRGKGRCAVVTGNDVDYGMARIARVHMELVGIELMVFRDFEEATRWLDWEGAREAHAQSLPQDRQHQ
jgi:hypothetical protein